MAKNLNSMATDIENVPYNLWCQSSYEHSVVKII
ncbi:DEHA2G06644p [Debaryomyces hansenii CBS767]|uniref:DEHA2G06644p n=1 Tax=Debaryomyces hansenii (strain ATCC 36239 / CBS 767 / BCRC 21394 / JCM 1990 / NBRC 0083 / IGC 2968) TaxID=284592 RepID=Q6BIY5_DEBHA|nr:DEHA2G06644p [Debaryomyces hansenii CBS767]CAG90297.1 DEHA2G06644p [Debaryomyces hansenii CBS767]|eukprot:XP_461836.1 DEHA2G06644p [Debaryomyces hansenii CBS767]